MQARPAASHFVAGMRRAAPRAAIGLHTGAHDRMADDARAQAFDRPEIFLSLGLSLVKQDKGAMVEALIADTLGRHPNDPLYHAIARMIRSHKVPRWHAVMLADDPRNAAYSAAIAAAAPGRVVLDIGTGSGLLAMIAARAGAERVVACEANPVVAEAARRIVAANGLDRKITIHACHSSKLDRSMIGGEGAELVMSEIFAADIVGEGVMPALAHARAELAAPGAVFLPEVATLRVALAELDPPPFRPLAAEGFDLSEFEPLYPAREFISDRPEALALRSEPADLLRLDWSSPDPLPVTGSAQITVAAQGGAANVVAQWLRIEFGNGVAYENAPHTMPGAHWTPLCHALHAPISPAAGAPVTIGAFYHTDQLALWAA